MNNQTKDLHTSDDVRKVREQLIQEQNQKCKLTGMTTATKDFHLDHAHNDTQLVRGALHKQANMALGRVEALKHRYLYWYDGTLPDFLRACADYLEKEPDTRWRHPGWKKKLQAKFNKLNSKQQNFVLESSGKQQGVNLVERKAKFKSLLDNRNFSFDVLFNLIRKSCEDQNQ